MENEVYEHIVVGAGISGCSVAYELSKYSDSVLLIDKLENVASGASGAAGAFLSPLLGKPNPFKDLITKSLNYSTRLYKKYFPNVISNCGTTRIPKNYTDREKFISYEPYMDFPYEVDGEGYYFQVGSVVNSFGVCKMMTSVDMFASKYKITTKFNYKVNKIERKDDLWLIDDKYKTKNLILTTGYDLDLLAESYIKIKPVWGQRIDIESSTKLDHNYHKACSVSKSFPIKDGNYKISIGATHHRNIEDAKDIEADNKTLLKRASEIVELKDIKITKQYFGARASSMDYFPVVGEIINSKKTLEEFPYMTNGTHVNSKRFTRYENLYMINGVGGRGFVLAPYLAKQLAEKIINNKDIDEEITSDRLFRRYVKRINSNG